MNQLNNCNKLIVCYKFNHLQIKLLRAKNQALARYKNRSPSRQNQAFVHLKKAFVHLKKPLRAKNKAP